MLYTIQNEHLTVRAESTGAQLASIRMAQTEYLWQGDAAYWADRAPTIFPYVARLTEGKYTYHGKTYSLPIHGFAPTAEFVLDAQSADSMTFLLASSDETLRQYPFHFRFYVTYALEGKSLHIRYRVENDSDETMYFGCGAHPGFNVPLEDGLCFEDYALRFTPACQPTQLGFTEDCFRGGADRPLALENSCELPLRHKLFDNDAIILADMSHTVTLDSPNGQRSITVHFPDQNYFGIWHKPCSDAPYVCLEPWSSLPSHKNVVEDLQTQEDLVALPAHQTYDTTITVSLT